MPTKSRYIPTESSEIRSHFTHIYLNQFKKYSHPTYFFSCWPKRKLDDIRSSLYSFIFYSKDSSLQSYQPLQIPGFFGIRCDWFPAIQASLDFQIENTSQSFFYTSNDPKAISRYQFGHSFESYKSKKVLNVASSPNDIDIQGNFSEILFLPKYLQFYQALMTLLYPHDSLHIYSYRKPKIQLQQLQSILEQRSQYSGNKLNNLFSHHAYKSSKTTGSSQKSYVLFRPWLCQLFPPSIFGFSFLSHAHIDHTPFAANCPFLRIGNSGEKIYPFPILCSKMTELLVLKRFGYRIVNLFHILTRPKSKWAKKFQNLLNAEKAAYWKHFLIQEHSFHENTIFSTLDEAILKIRLKEYFQLMQWFDWWIWLVPTGHILGSAGLCVISKSTAISYLQNIHSNRGDKVFSRPSYVFMGEWNPNFMGVALPPPRINCDTMILDSLFLDVRLSFPNPQNEWARFLQWILRTLQTYPVIIFCHDMGKPPVIAHLLAKKHVSPPQDNNFEEPKTYPVELVVSKTLAGLLYLLPIYGIPIASVISKNQARKLSRFQTQNYIRIESPHSRDKPSIQRLIKTRQAKTVEMTGWAIDPAFREKYTADQYFDLSDHAVFGPFTQYMAECDIDQVCFTPENPFLEYYFRLDPRN
jgi:hypothetical protein